ncbi:MAG: hypothetical protein ACREUP_05755, partial [Burkholderiales bacterium]
MSRFTRRQFIATGAAAAGVAGLAAGFIWRHRGRPVELASRGELPLPIDPEFPNPLRLPGADGMYGVFDAAGSFAMVAKPVSHALLPGRPGPMLAYEVEHQGRTLLN